RARLGENSLRLAQIGQDRAQRRHFLGRSPSIAAVRRRRPLARLLGLRRAPFARPSRGAPDEAGRALLAQQLLHPFDRVAFAVEQLLDRAQELDVAGPIVASAAAAL